MSAPVMICEARPAQPVASDTRVRVVAVAGRLFREVGYQKTTVADIARALGMSPANVYRFFESKKAINEAVVGTLIGDLEETIHAIADATDRSAADRLRAVILTMHERSASMFRDHPRMQEVIEAAMTESWSVCQHHVARIGAVIAAVIAAGIATGEFAPTDPDRAARCVHAAILRFCHPVLVIRADAAFMPTLDEMTAFLLAALRAQAPDAGYSDAGVEGGAASLVPGCGPS